MYTLHVCFENQHELATMLYNPYFLYHYHLEWLRQQPQRLGDASGSHKLGFIGKDGVF